MHICSLVCRIIPSGGYTGVKLHLLLLLHTTPSSLSLSLSFSFLASLGLCCVVGALLQLRAVAVAHVGFKHKAQ